ncbi:MAG TPA: ABC transporter permease subunit [Thermomonospora sp.]|nr:ABC transporter permease subunit [Thermomonospora sp.]
MIWLTWRQFRVQAAAGSAALAALAAVLAVTGPGLADDYASGIAACGTDEACEMFARHFFDQHRTSFQAVLAVVLLLPALVGLFWGAPLITRELEAGTHRLAWSQSVTRTRWLAVKLGVTGLASMLVAGLASLAVTWWASPVDRAAGSEFPRMTPLLFDARGIVPIGYAAFAFVLGVTVGMLVRRTLPAMAVTVAVFTAVQIGMPLLVRPYLLPPTRTTVTVTAGNLDALMADGPGRPFQMRVEAPDPNAWILSNETVDRSGRTVKTVPLYPGTGPCARDKGPETCVAEIGRLGYRQRLVYHPSSRFWAFQWLETGLYGVLTAGLGGFCFWWIRRRLS